MEDSDTMSGNVKAATAVFGGGGVIALAATYWNDRRVLGILLIGCAAVVVLLFAYSWLVKYFRRKSSAGIVAGVGAEGRKVPMGASAADQDMLTDMRERFMQGMRVFEEGGGNLYEYPWFLVVGERSAGKTRLIDKGTKDCRSGEFVPGLGGTINMNWWFTEHAVLLDTAGALMLPEIDTGKNELWDKFLEMLLKWRPNCPINGVILVIPADTLQTDTPEQIDEKARRIANELGKVRRRFKMRFPVFVSVTKCDKIVGFREFFEKSALDSQILGWSNPAADLDAPFDPAQIDDHLKGVREALVRHRFQLLKNPVNTEAASGLRLDQVDALYQFPDKLMKLTQSLQRYLRPILTRTPETPKRLFLRGIYFSSSLQTGKAVDMALSRALGRSLKEMEMLGGNDENVISQRSLFVTDAFTQKVFPEKGLVTREDNVTRLKRRRRVAIYGSLIGAAVLLIGFTLFQKQDLNDKIMRHTKFWVPLVYARDAAKIVDGAPPAYLGTRKPLETDTLPETADGRGLSIIAFHENAVARLDEPMKPPFMYGLMNVLAAGDFTKKKVGAYRVFFENSVLNPVVDSTLASLQNPDCWKDSTSSARSTEALKQLLAVEGPRGWSAIQPASAPSGNGGLPTTGPAAPNSLEGLLGFLFPANGPDDHHRQVLMASLSELSRRLSKDDPDWMRKSVLAADASRKPSSADQLTVIVRDQFCKQWKADEDLKKSRADSAKRVLDYLIDYKDKRQAIADLWLPAAPSSEDSATAFIEQWTAAMGALKVVHQKLAAELTKGALKDWNNKLDPVAASSLSVFYQTKVAELAATKKADCQKLLDAIPREATTLTPLRGELEAQMKSADAETREAGIQQLSDQIKQYEWLLAVIPDSARNPARRYQVEWMVADEADALLTPRKPYPENLTDAIKQLAEATSKAQTALDRIAIPAEPKDDKILPVNKLVLDLAARRGRQNLTLKAVRSLIGRGDGAPTNPDDQLLRVMAAVPLAKNDTVSLPELPLVTVPSIAAHFQPARMTWLLDQRAQIAAAGGFDVPKPPDKPDNVLDRKALETEWNRLKAAIDGLVGKYKAFWKKDVLAVKAIETRWSDLISEKGGLSSMRNGWQDVNESLSEYGKLRVKALKAVGDPDAEACAARFPEEPVVKIGQRIAEWWKIGDAKEDARGMILKMKPEDFLKNLFYDEGSVGGADDIVATYWRGIFREFLRSKAAASQEDAEKAYKELHALANGFPLNAESSDDMSLVDLKNARKALSKFRDENPADGTLGSSKTPIVIGRRQKDSRGSGSDE
jgi:hypothetical protein